MKTKGLKWLKEDIRMVNSRKKPFVLDDHSQIESFARDISMVKVNVSRSIPSLVST